MRRGIAGPLARWLGEKPTSVAVLDGEGATTWGEVGALAHRWAEELRGDASATVALLVPESAAALALLAAVELANRHVVLVPSPYATADAMSLLRSTGARRLLAARGAELTELAAASASMSAAAPEPDATVTLMTSGSTGRPKLVCHTWQTLSGAVNADERFAGRRWLIGYPLAHFAGLQVLMQVVATGGTLVIPRDFSPAAAREALRQRQPTQLNCTPTYLRRLLMETPGDEWVASSLAHVTLGGEIVDQRLLDTLLARLPDCRITHIYASTELGAAIVVRDRMEGFPASLIDNERLKIIDGELCVRRDDSRSMLHYAGSSPSLPTDWMRTGDLVERDTERVRFRGRVDDIINVGGFKVAPVAVEEVIQEVAGVDEVRVSAHASSVVGSLLKALVATSVTDEVALRSAIEKRCDERLPYYMRPRMYLFMNELPMTASQKLARRS